MGHGKFGLQVIGGSSHSLSDIQRLNAIVNQPEVCPFVAPGYCDIDMSGFFANKLNIAIMDDDGAMLFAHMGAGAYEAHYLFTMSRRGWAALEFARSAIALMFTAHGASAIHGATPRENRAARVVNRALGAVPYGEFIDSQGRAFIRYVLDRRQWAQSLAA